MSSDPYAPPLAALDGLTPSESSDGGLRYSTFWSRVGAALLDVVFLMPLYGLDFLIGGHPRFYLYMVVPTALITLFYYVFLVTRYGATPGKKLVGLRIAMLDGSAVTAKAAFLRYGMWWLFALLSSFSMITAASTLPAEAFEGVSYMARSAALTAAQPGWASGIMWAMQLFFWGSIITMLINKKRRTLHDMIAGTVVVRAGK